jgi:hypothetical protein
MSSAAVPVENIPGIVKAIPGSGENRSPSRRNRCSPSARNPVRLHPGTLFTFTPESFSPSPGIRPHRCRLVFALMPAVYKGRFLEMLRYFFTPINIKCVFEVAVKARAFVF